MTTGTLLTIDDEGRKLAENVARVTGASAGTALLADVGQNPISGDHGVSNRAPAAVSVPDEHLREFGVASEPRKGGATLADVDALIAR